MELSERLAAVETAPLELIRTLARDGDATVAAPVLTNSVRLSEQDLVQIAQTYGQGHLLAISGRREVAQAVTDVILERGEQQVILKLARNSGARFSESGFATLSQRAERDFDLAETVGLRLDLPVKFLRELLARATEAVRAKLLAAAPRFEGEISKMLSAIGDMVGKEVSATRSYSAAERAVAKLFEQGLLDADAVANFAREGEIEELSAGLARLSDMSVEMVAKLVQSREPTRS